MVPVAALAIFHDKKIEDRRHLSVLLVGNDTTDVHNIASNREVDGDLVSFTHSLLSFRNLNPFPKYGNGPLRITIIAQDSLGDKQDVFLI